jgi:biopolymer transport protein ExbB/TolQ
MNDNFINVQSMFLNADPLVQWVMIILFIASLFTWAIIIEKTIVLRRSGRAVRLLKKAVKEKPIKENDLTNLPKMVRQIVSVGLSESRDGVGAESRADYRARVEGAMRLALAERLDRLGRRSLFLASVGSTSPFIGLFGTVWGIMHSFIGIASSGETTLAVVAPGIAEALFATAMGLVAAIPAVLSFNMVTGSVKKIGREALGSIKLLSNYIAFIYFKNNESDNKLVK